MSSAMEELNLYEDKELPWNYDLDKSYFGLNDGDKKID